MCSLMLQVQTSGASADKWQLKANVDKGRKCGDCLCRQVHMLHVRKDVANHVDGEKAMEERTLEARQ